MPIPINRTTINRLYGLDLDEAGVAAFLDRVRLPTRAPRSTREDAIVSRVGRELYETFFRGYTRKQWGLDPVAARRVGVADASRRARTSDDRYFTDRFRRCPSHGYTAMVERMLGSPAYRARAGVDYSAVAARGVPALAIFTGPIDEYFDHRYGRLPYRSLRFEFETIDRERVQDAACINEPSADVPYTRTTEYKYLTGQTHAKTLVSREYPTAEGDPYYPIPMPESARSTNATGGSPHASGTSRSWVAWRSTGTTTWIKRWRPRSPRSRSSQAPPRSPRSIAGR